MSGRTFEWRQAKEPGLLGYYYEGRLVGDVCEVEPGRWYMRSFLRPGYRWISPSCSSLQQVMDGLCDEIEADIILLVEASLGALP